MTKCPNCGEAKERLAGHWRFCGYPMLSTHQRAVLRGLMLAGATVGGNGKNRFVTIGTTHSQLAEWVAEQLDWLCHSVREVAGEEERETVYRIRTAAHPQCNRYERWRKLPGSSGRKPPGDLVLERTTARVWWAFAGGLQWSGPYDSQVVGTFSAARDERAEAYERVLSDAGYEATRAGKRVQLPPTGVKRWLDWIGQAVPGVEHKWQTDKAAYKALRTEPKTESDYRTALYTAALEIARARTAGELTEQRFENRVEGIQAQDVADWLGGGSWKSALDVASVEQKAESERPPQRTADGNARADKYSKSEVDKWIVRAAEACGQPLRQRDYNNWTNNNPEAPSVFTIEENYGWSSTLLENGVEPGVRKGQSLETLLTAVVRIYEQIGEWPNTEEYKQYRKSSEPTPEWFYSNDTEGIETWSGVVEEAKSTHTDPH